MVKLILFCVAWMAVSGKMRSDKKKSDIADEIFNRKGRH